jgi:thiol:disulfide interchange protein
MRLCTLRSILLGAAISLGAATATRAAPEYPRMGADIYDVHADGEAQLTAALQKASAEHRRVLLDFGANWCPWCRKLHAILEDDPKASKFINENYIVVMIDVNIDGGKNRNAGLNRKYGDPGNKGVPLLVIVDGEGKQLAAKTAPQLGNGEAFVLTKIEGFLSDWAPRR